MGIEWEYEKEGYETQLGWYLPDFWLPGVDAFAEVKGSQHSCFEISKCNSVSVNTGKSFVFLDGVPSLSPYVIIRPDHKATSFREAMVGVTNLQVLFNEYLQRPHFVVWAHKHDDAEGLTCMLHNQRKVPFGQAGRAVGDLMRRRHTDICKSCMLKFTNPTQLVGNAISAARSARFEHGERGW
jgi:hypothetical protein